MSRLGEGASAELGVSARLAHRVADVSVGRRICTIRTSSGVAECSSMVSAYSTLLCDSESEVSDHSLAEGDALT